MCTAVISVPRAGQKMSNAPRTRQVDFACVFRTPYSRSNIYRRHTKDQRKNKKIKTNRKNEKRNVLAFVGGQRSEVQTISRRTTIIRRRRFRVEGQPRVHTGGGVRGFYFFNLLLDMLPRSREFTAPSFTFSVTSVTQSTGRTTIGNTDTVVNTRE